MPSLKSQVMPKPGDRVGKYVLSRVIGEGGMGVVFEAEHVQVHSRVAVKMLHPKAAHIPNVVTRFEREARAAGQLRSVHVARVLDVDATKEGLPYLVMELLEGRDLAADNAMRGPRPLEEAVGIVLQVADGMTEAHSHGIVHRDLKPSNIFLTTHGDRIVAKVLDFGISKIDAQAPVSMTATDAVIGTPLYMSPEQIRSSKAVDARTDIWALGVILYELLAGSLPFEGESATSLAVAIVSDVPRSIFELRPDLPPAFVETLEKALAKRPDERFQDMATLAAALTPFAPPGATPFRLSSPSLSGSDVSVPTGGWDRGSSNRIEGLSQRVFALQQLTTLSGSSIAGGTGRVSRRIRDRILNSPRVRGALIATLGGAVGVAATFLLVARPAPDTAASRVAMPSVAVSSAVSSPTTPTPTVAQAPPAFVAPEASESLQAPDVLANTPAKAASAPPARPATKRALPPAAPAKAKGGCSPPYFVDAVGHRQYKPECL